MSTIVIFRKYKDNDAVLALFPYEIARLPYDIQCYEHLGQHSYGDYQTCINITRPAKPHEYADLLKELQSIGYDELVIRRKRNQRLYEQALQKAYGVKNGKL